MEKLKLIRERNQPKNLNLLIKEIIVLIVVEDRKTHI